MSADAPLSDWQSRAPHSADECRLDQCDFCGCCVHGKAIALGCKVEAAPWGMSCPSYLCGCEGKS